MVRQVIKLVCENEVSRGETMVDENLIIEELERIKSNFKKFQNKNPYKKHISIDQLCYIFDKIITYIDGVETKNK